MPGPTVVSSGTQTATLDTEHELYATTSSGHYSASVDLLNMATGDITIIRIYKKVLTGSTQAIIDARTFSGAQAEKVYFIPFVSCPFGYRLTLEQTDGVGADYPWSVETP